MRILGRLLVFIADQMVGQDIRHLERNIQCAPLCCDNPMKYIGEHSGHFLKTQFYQCQVCKRLEILHKHEWEK